MAEKTMLDGLANMLAVATVLTRKKKPTVRKTRTARQVLDKQGNVVTLYTETETVTTTLKR